MRFRTTGLCLALLLAGSGCVSTNRDLAAPVAPDDRGLVAHWTFDEGGGAVARDVTGNGHDAVLTGTEWVPSPRGHALRFDAKDDAARYGNTASMNMDGDLTLALWARVDPTINADTCRLLVGDTGWAVERNFSLYFEPDILRFEWTDGASVAALTAPSTLINNTWQHIVVVASSGARQAAMYIDGEPVADTEMPFPITRTAFNERMTGWFYNGFFTGELDDVRLYSRALSGTEVRLLFTSQADVQVGLRPLLFDSAAPEPRSTAPLVLRNWSREPRRAVIGDRAAGAQELTLRPGQEIEVMQEAVAIRSISGKRTDLFLSAQDVRRVAVTVYRGEAAETQQAVLVPFPFVEPLQVVVANPWQAGMTPGKTEQITVGVTLAMPASRRREGALNLRLVSCETGKQVLAQQIKDPAMNLTLPLDVRSLAWGAYDLTVSFRNRAGATPVSTTRELTVLPGGKQQIRVLNNLVSELMDARARGLLDQPRIEFMNPRDGWVWFKAAGACAVRLPSPPAPLPGGEGSGLLTARAGQPAVEAMRLLPAGRHVLDVGGTPTDLIVRAIPALVYNVYPSGPQIAPFGQNTWERLSRYMLPNVNMIESPRVDTPEHKEWLAQGKFWLANVLAPGLLDKTEWTVEKMIEVWLNPGKPTGHAERPGLTLDKLSGVQVDEYVSGGNPHPRDVRTTTASIADLADTPAYTGKLWIPFFAGRRGATTEGLPFLKTVLANGWPFSEEGYLGEARTEAENRAAIRGQFNRIGSMYDKASPGSVRRMIFTLSYCYLPSELVNCYPQADFRVHLDMQMQALATEPALLGLWGVQPYRSNYIDEEILNCMALLLRHYCIEGRTERMLNDPYELRHVSDPDFAEGLGRWRVSAAEPGSVSAATLAGYGRLQGRYPVGTMGDTFAILKRNAQAPNVISQQLQGITPGRLYSLKVLTGDYADLQAGKSRKDQQVLSTTLDGAEVQPGGFSYPWMSYGRIRSTTTSERFWMTYHWLRFRATGPTATLTISDWAGPAEPGGPVGQQTMVNFVEVQPVLETTVSPE